MDGRIQRADPLGKPYFALNSPLRGEKNSVGASRPRHAVKFARSNCKNPPKRVSKKSEGDLAD
jgi:hypothetical protein